MKKIIELLQSGDFTIIYWDSQEPTLYKGKWNKEKEYDRDEYETMNKSEVKIPWEGEIGYAPSIVALLTKALKGNIDSI